MQVSLLSWPRGLFDAVLNYSTISRLQMLPTLLYSVMQAPRLWKPHFALVSWLPTEVLMRQPAAGGRGKNFPSSALFTIARCHRIRPFTGQQQSIPASASPHAPRTSLPSVWGGSGTKECPLCGSKLQVPGASLPCFRGNSSGLAQPHPGTWVPALCDNFQFWWLQPLT